MTLDSASRTAVTRSSGGSSGGTPVPGWLRELAEAGRAMEIAPLFQPPASGGRALGAHVARVPG
jgi:hypothetical protein